MSEHKKPHSDAPEGAEQRVVSPRARKEEEILATWTEKKIFQKSVDKAAPKGDFVFYDGPPFATGLPHYGHILPSTMKDMVPRYKTMRGYRVRRRWGWDCHGLPVENLVEKELGLKTKKDIIDYGIEKFNAAARSSVMKYADEWRTIIPRLGRFVDMENDYETMSCTYTESVWWAFKSLHDKGLIYEGFKSMHLCPRCETTLSNFEVNQGYKDITDISVYVKFRIKDAGSTEPTFALAWTTTPWTLPGNVALAIHPDLDYVYASSEGETYIVAKEKAVALFKDKQYTVTKEVKGSELVGQSYEPVFTYYSDASSAAGAALKHRDNAWKIYAADYVTLEKGSGIVHIAPAFGEEDLLLAQRVSLPIVHHVSTNGAFTKDVKDFAGMFVKEKSTPENKAASSRKPIGK